MQSHCPQPTSAYIHVLLQAVELGRRIGQGSRRVSHAGASPRRQSSMLDGLGPRRQSSGSGSRPGLRRSMSLSRVAPMQLEQLLTGDEIWHNMAWHDMTWQAWLQALSDVAQTVSCSAQMYVATDEAPHKVCNMQCNILHAQPL